jgi:hypothetical protein
MRHVLVLESRLVAGLVRCQESAALPDERGVVGEQDRGAVIGGEGDAQIRTTDPVGAEAHLVGARHADTRRDPGAGEAGGGDLPAESGAQGLPVVGPHGPAMVSAKVISDTSCMSSLRVRFVRHVLERARRPTPTARRGRHRDHRLRSCLTPHRARPPPRTSPGTPQDVGRRMGGNNDSAVILASAHADRGRRDHRHARSRPRVLALRRRGRAAHANPVRDDWRYSALQPPMRGSPSPPRAAPSTGWSSMAGE